MRYAEFGQCRTNRRLQCKVALLCENLGVHGTQAISFGNFVGYTWFSGAHYVPMYLYNYVPETYLRLRTYVRMCIHTYFHLHTYLRYHSTYVPSTSIPILTLLGLCTSVTSWD